MVIISEMSRKEWRIRAGNYLLGRCIGGGQHSKVREAYKSSKYYAFKYIKLTKDPATNAHFQDLVATEAKAMVKVGHPRILQLCDWCGRMIMEKPGGRTVPVACLVFELMSNGELIGYIRIGGRLSEQIARLYFLQLIEAVQYLHLKGIVHRDIKAENILLDDEFQLKLSDFGFAAPINGKDGSGHLHTYKGTYRYMAPEIHAAPGYSGEKVDVFACGVLLFIMAVGIAPFRSAKVSDPNYVMLQGNQKLFWSDLAAVDKKLELSQEFKSLFESLVCYEPEKRPSIAQIKKHPWLLNEAVVSPKELKAEFLKRKEIFKESLEVPSETKKKAYEKLVCKPSTKASRDKSVRKKKESKRKARKKEATDEVVTHRAHSKDVSAIARHRSRSRGRHRARSRDRSRSESRDIDRLETYEEVIVFANVQTRVFDPQVFFTREKPDKILARAKVYLDKHGYEYRERRRKYKIFMDNTIDEERMVISMKVMKVDRKKCCLKLKKLTGDTIAYWHILDGIERKIKKE